MIDGDLGAGCGRLGLFVRQRRPSGGGDPLATQAESLQRLIKEASSKPTPRGVHHLRTTIRRVEALLPEPTGDVERIERKLMKQLDRIRKRAGKIRDVDVHLREIRTLTELAGDEEHQRVCRTFEKARAKWRRRLVRTLERACDDGLTKRLRRVVGRAVDDGTGRVRTTVTPVLEGFAVLLQSTGMLTAANLHEFRKQAKRLRYVAEVAEPTPEAKIAVAQLKRIQDAIGGWHDWVVLSERSAEILDGAVGSPLLAAIRIRREVQLEKALAVTAAAVRRLAILRPASPRKSVRPMTRIEAIQLRQVGASA